MLTKLKIRNFKRFADVEIELGQNVVFIGPNNSGKTTALQGLALWNTGLKLWMEKRGGRLAPEKRPGVTINRRDLVAVPVPDANLLWHDLHVRDVRKIEGKQLTSNIRVDILVEGINNGKLWTCGLEFDYNNEESFYCRPLRTGDGKNSERMSVPEEVRGVNVAFLPPMSGLADREFVKQPGEISFLVGQGRTAEVLRNLCYRLVTSEGGQASWFMVKKYIQDLFGIELNQPRYMADRSELEMTYKDRSGIQLDLSSAGRGLQQTLLILAYLAANPSSVLLLDEPDAHLEILRQRQIYELLTKVAQEQGSQIIAASHSEVILNEAADRDVVVAFLGNPHRIDDRGSQLLKSLREIGFDQYYQAEQEGWVLYLEGSTDLAILRAFAEILEHPALSVLDRPFVHYVGNQPQKARDHFYGLCEARSDLIGFALFDRLPRNLDRGNELTMRMWTRCEIENYLCQKETLLSWAQSTGEEQLGPLFGTNWANIMDECITEIEGAMTTLGKGSPWSVDTKVTDNFLDPLFAKFYNRLGLPNLMRKTDYHLLAKFAPRNSIDQEVRDVLDDILRASQSANPSVI